MDFKVNSILEEILLVENVVPVSYQNAIIERVQGENHFPWFLLHRIGHPSYYPKGTTPVYQDTNITDDSGFVHMAFDGEPKSPSCDFFRAVLEFFSEKTGIKIGKLLRIRLRYTHSNSTHNSTQYAAPHVDFSTARPYSTLVYYVDDSDGDTIIFDKIFREDDATYDPVNTGKLTELLRVTPKKGVGLFFNGHRYHAGNFPIKFSSRIIINFDFETL